MSKLEVTYCQYTSCDGCRQKNICKVKRGGPKKEVTTRTCKECGFVNTKDALNCVKCGNPLII